MNNFNISRKDLKQCNNHAAASVSTNSYESVLLHPKCVIIVLREKTYYKSTWV